MWRLYKTAFRLLTKAIGRLALSRALGDFEFKKNSSLTPENQIITADPDVTLHDITEEEEFLVLASDGALHSIISCSFPYIPAKVFGNACHHNKLSTLFVSKSPKAKSSMKSVK
jgi:Protein phosphatase 2C